MTTEAEISRLAASGMTSEVGASITSSLTIMLRRTGRQLHEVGVCSFHHPKRSHVLGSSFSGALFDVESNDIHAKVHDRLFDRETGT